MSHYHIDKKQKESIGITDNLIRLSVGLEDIEDILADLDQALDAAFHHTQEEEADEEEKADVKEEEE